METVFGPSQERYDVTLLSLRVTEPTAENERKQWIVLEICAGKTFITASLLLL